MFLFILKLTAKYKFKVFLAFLMLMGGVILTLPQPLLTKYLIDNVLMKGGDVKALYNVIVIFFLIAILRTAFSSLSDYLFSLINEKVVFDIEILLLKRFQYASLMAHNLKKGEIQTRLKSDVSSLGSVFIPSIINALKEGLTLITGLILIFYLNPTLATISISLYPLFILLMLKYNKKIRKANSDYFCERSISGGVLFECINLMPVFKSMSRNSFNIIKYLKSSKKSFYKNIKRIKVGMENSMILGFVLMLIPIIVFAYGGYQVISGIITLGTLVAFNSYLAYLYRPTSSLLNFNVGMQQAFAAWERIKGVLNLEQEKETGKKVDSIDSLSLRDICFSYDNKLRLLNNISVDFVKGNCYGFIGESGSGKTTLVELIMGVLPPSTGRILVSNNNLEDIDIISYRRKIGYISQEPILFNDSIFNNIAIGGKSVIGSDVFHAAKQANVSNFVELLERGYDTILNEDAKNISIGEKQRIALARALVSSPELLILDEPTASIDVESETLIVNSLKSYKNSKILIIITHRLPLLQICDYVFRLEEGKLWTI